jgi:Recombinase
MADAKTPMQKQREQRRAQGWRDVNVWLTPEGQQRIARLIEPGESLSTLIDRALVALEALHSGKTIRARTSEVTSEQPEDLQSLIASEVSRYFTSDGFRDNLFIPVLKQALSSYLPSDVTRYLTSELITVQALPAHNSSPGPQTPVMPESKAAILTRLRTMQAEGLSLQAMANRLNNEGVLTFSGKGRWQKGTIGHLLASAIAGRK